MKAARWLAPAVLLLLGTAGCTGADRQPEPSTWVSPSASVAPTPAFTDITTGDTGSVVWLRGYDTKARSAVVEPTIFMDGPKFCQAFRVPETDARCERPWVTEDSRRKVTLPVSPKVKLTTVGEGNAECVDFKIGTGAGSCPWTAAAMLQRRDDGDGLLVHLTTRDGTVTRIAELYFP